MAIVELRTTPTQAPLGGVPFPLINHEFNGKTYLYTSNSIQVEPIDIPSPTQLMRLQRYPDLQKNRTPERIIAEARWSLQRGLVDFTGVLLDQMLSDLDEAEASGQPLSVDAKTQTVIDAYRKLKGAMSKPLPSNPAANEWKLRLNYVGIRTSPHYTMIHNIPGANPNEVTRRLDLLERAYAGFYYWFALQGLSTLEVPEQRLLTILCEKSRDFSNARRVFDVAELPTDGFLTTDYNVAFFAPTRLDAPFRDFSQRVSQLYTRKGWDPKDLVQGKIPKPSRNQPRPQGTDIAYAQTMALAERALLHEAEVAATSQVGTQQLMIALGLLPQRVTLPEWAAFSLPNFFATPKGPFPSESTGIKVAMWESVGGPSWAFARYFQDLDRDKKLDSPTKTLQGVIDDTFFRTAHAKARVKPDDDETPKERQERRTETREAIAKARTLAWGLAYFLVKEKFDGLRRFAQELDRLPRDLQFTSTIKAQLFRRAFALEEDADFQAFAEDWVKFLRGVQTPTKEVKLEYEPPAPNPRGFQGGFGGGGTPPGGGS